MFKVEIIDKGKYMTLNMPGGVVLFVHYSVEYECFEKLSTMKRKT